MNEEDPPLIAFVLLAVGTLVFWGYFAIKLILALL